MFQPNYCIVFVKLLFAWSNLLIAVILLPTMSSLAINLNNHQNQARTFSVTTENGGTNRNNNLTSLSLEISTRAPLALAAVKAAGELTTTLSAAARNSSSAFLNLTATSLNNSSLKTKLSHPIKLVVDEFKKDENNKSVESVLHTTISINSTELNELRLRGLNDSTLTPTSNLFNNKTLKQSSVQDSAFLPEQLSHRSRVFQKQIIENRKNTRRASHQQLINSSTDLTGLASFRHEDWIDFNQSALAAEAEAEAQSQEDSQALANHNKLLFGVISGNPSIILKNVTPNRTTLIINKQQQEQSSGAGNSGDVGDDSRSELEPSASWNSIATADGGGGKDSSRSISSNKTASLPPALRRRIIEQFVRNGGDPQNIVVSDSTITTTSQSKKKTITTVYKVLPTNNSTSGGSFFAKTNAPQGASNVKGGTSGVKSQQQPMQLAVRTEMARIKHQGHDSGDYDDEDDGGGNGGEDDEDEEGGNGYHKADFRKYPHQHHQIGGPFSRPPAFGQQTKGGMTMHHGGQQRLSHHGSPKGGGTPKRIKRVEKIMVTRTEFPLRSFMNGDGQQRRQQNHHHEKEHQLKHNAGQLDLGEFYRNPGFDDESSAENSDQQRQKLGGFNGKFPAQLEHEKQKTFDKQFAAPEKPEMPATKSMSPIKQTNWTPPATKGRKQEQQRTDEDEHQQQQIRSKTFGQQQQENNSIESLDGEGEVKGKIKGPEMRTKTNAKTTTTTTNKAPTKSFAAGWSDSKPATNRDGKGKQGRPLSPSPKQQQQSEAIEEVNNSDNNSNGEDYNQQQRMVTSANKHLSNFQEFQGTNGNPPASMKARASTSSAQAQGDDENNNSNNSEDTSSGDESSAPMESPPAAIPAKMASETTSAEPDSAEGAPGAQRGQQDGETAIRASDERGGGSNHKRRQQAGTSTNIELKDGDDAKSNGRQMDGEERGRQKRRNQPTRERKRSGEDEDIQEDRASRGSNSGSRSDSGQTSGGSGGGGRVRLAKARPHSSPASAAQRQKLDSLEELKKSVAGRSNSNKTPESRTVTSSPAGSGNKRRITTTTNTTESPSLTTITDGSLDDEGGKQAVRPNRQRQREREEKGGGKVVSTTVQPKPRRKQKRKRTEGGSSVGGAVSRQRDKNFTVRPEKTSKTVAITTTSAPVVKTKTHNIMMLIDFDPPPRANAQEPDLNNQQQKLTAYEQQDELKHSVKGRDNAPKAGQPTKLGGWMPLGANRWQLPTANNNNIEQPIVQQQQQQQRQPSLTGKQQQQQPAMVNVQIYNNHLGSQPQQQQLRRPSSNAAATSNGEQQIQEQQRLLHNSAALDAFEHSMMEFDEAAASQQYKYKAPVPGAGGGSNLAPLAQASRQPPSGPSFASAMFGTGRAAAQVLSVYEDDSVSEATADLTNGGSYESAVAAVEAAAAVAAASEQAAVGGRGANINAATDEAVALHDEAPILPGESARTNALVKQVIDEIASSGSSSELGRLSPAPPHPASLLPAGNMTTLATQTANRALLSGELANHGEPQSYTTTSVRDSTGVSDSDEDDDDEADAGSSRSSRQLAAATAAVDRIADLITSDHFDQLTAGRSQRRQTQN